MKIKKIILIISIIMILGIIAFFVFAYLQTKDMNVNPNSNLNTSVGESGKKEDLSDLISLELDDESKNLKSNTILIDYDTNIEIKEIKLPDGTKTFDNLKKYEVVENGTYKFIFTLEDNTKIEKSIKISNIKKVKRDEPTFIPDGFSHVEGTVDDGYIIADQYGNEFVWVPVDNGKAIRNVSDENKYVETDDSSKYFYNSVAKNYGFYISRYEAGKASLEDEIVAVSMKEMEPWYGATFKDALKYSDEFCNVFGYSDVKSSLINSYAWDSTLAWIDENNDNYSTSTKNGNYSNEIYVCGNSEDCINGIYDLSGNLREWTTELLKDYAENEKFPVIKRVIRGGCVKTQNSAKKRTSFSEESKDDYWGFRLVLYK